MLQCCYCYMLLPHNYVIVIVCKYCVCVIASNITASKCHHHCAARCCCNYAIQLLLYVAAIYFAYMPHSARITVTYVHGWYTGLAQTYYLGRKVTTRRNFSMASDMGKLCVRSFIYFQFPPFHPSSATS